MVNEDLIKSVKQVFSEAKNKQFVIPPYQRGYKWNKENVQKLLNDLMNFEKGNALNCQSFYCIQNITIVPLPDNSGWNVVDGQQRITTLFILLSYLRNYQNNEDFSFFSSPKCLSYKVREKTGEFLENDIFTGKIWKSKINAEVAQSKDLWFILDVADGIQDWFSTKGNSLQIRTITERLKLIVNDMASITVSEEEIFAGLNGGKVDLDGADLVKAELITRAAKDKYKAALAPKVKEFRIRIALELDEMNLWWSNSEHKKYFEQFLPDKLRKANIFNHDVYPLGLLYKLYYLIHKKDGEEFGIEFFENGRNFNVTPDDDHWELYESLMKLHYTMQTWYSDSRLYHWIGYLMFNFKNKMDLRSLWLKWEEKSTTKEVFLSEIIKFIKSELNSRQNNLVENIKNVGTQWYGKDPTGITLILVLMDVMICTGLYVDRWEEDDIKKMLHIKNLKATKTRLPVAYFSKANENFEHIRSCEPNHEEGKEVREKKTWEKHIKMLYQDSDTDSDEAKMKEALMEILSRYEGDTLDDTVISKLNIEMNKYGQHSLGNMALLDEHVNKSYGNDPFQKKIQRIFKEYMNDKWYIRPYTMMEFEHAIEDDDTVWRWTQKNIVENANNIAGNVELFLNMKL